jgi:twitching motility two-component system response regulator PilH
MKKILIADDEEEALSILEKKLRENNYYVNAVTNGKDVIRVAKSDRPDLMILDIVMPDMDGYALATILKEDKLLKDVPIIFITGKELMPEGVQDRVFQLGAYDYIMKPCVFEDILTKVKKVLG